MDAQPIIPLLLLCDLCVLCGKNLFLQLPVLEHCPAYQSEEALRVFLMIFAKKHFTTEDTEIAEKNERGIQETHIEYLRCGNRRWMRSR